MPDPVEARLNILEHNYFDLHARLARSEDTSAFLNTKCSVLSEGLMRCHQVRKLTSQTRGKPNIWQWNQDLATYVMRIVPDPENQIHKDGE